MGAIEPGIMVKWCERSASRSSCSECHLPCSMATCSAERPEWSTGRPIWQSARSNACSSLGWLVCVMTNWMSEAPVSRKRALTMAGWRSSTSCTEWSTVSWLEAIVRIMSDITSMAGCSCQLNELPPAPKSLAASPSAKHSEARVSAISLVVFVAGSCSSSF